MHQLVKKKTVANSTSLLIWPSPHQTRIPPSAVRCKTIAVEKQQITQTRGVVTRKWTADIMTLAIRFLDADCGGAEGQLTTELGVLALQCRTFPVQQNSTYPASYPDNWIFLLTTGYIGSLKFGCYYLQYVPTSKGTRWRSRFSHCATRREVVGSIPDGVTGIFHWHNPSSCTIALGYTQPLTEMSTRNISLG